MDGGASIGEVYVESLETVGAFSSLLLKFQSVVRSVVFLSLSLLIESSTVNKIQSQFQIFFLL